MAEPFSFEPRLDDIPNKEPSNNSVEDHCCKVAKRP
jgi:hypothetical protein